MLSDLRNTIEYELDYLLKIERKMNRRKRELSQYEDLSLDANMQHGKLRYYLVSYKDGKRIKRYISDKEGELRQIIQERYFLSKALPLYRKNIEMLEEIKEGYCSYNPDDIVANAPLAYREQENARRLIQGYSGVERWRERKLAEKAKYNTPYEENLTHMALDGTMTRSKSEALIVDLLNVKGITYVYDYPMWLSGKLKWPDFLILNKQTGEELIIEHMGKMNDELYFNNQVEKVKLYIKSGYVPNVNLLLTFDDIHGNINVPIISKMIDAFIK